MRRFGQNWGSSELPRVPTPIGWPCVWCSEPIEKDDKGIILPQLNGQGIAAQAAYHRECFLRQVVGSLAHQTKKCSCFGGAGEDDKNLTKREAAKKATAFFERKR